MAGKHRCHLLVSEPEILDGFVEPAVMPAPKDRPEVQAPSAARGRRGEHLSGRCHNRANRTWGQQLVELVAELEQKGCTYQLGHFHLRNS